MRFTICFISMFAFCWCNGRTSESLLAQAIDTPGAASGTSRPAQSSSVSASSVPPLVGPNGHPSASPLDDRFLIFDQNDAIDQLLTRLALSHVPSHYVEDKKWAGQTERWDGVKIERVDGRLETHRRKKLVNDGSWKKYSLSLRNPTEEFQVQVRNLVNRPDGKMAFSIHVAAHVDFIAQQVEWKKGVKLLSLTVQGHTLVHIEVDMEIDVQSVGTRFPPDLMIKPSAVRTSLRLDDFRIDRVGKVGGEIAQQLGREAQRRLTARLPAYEQKVTEKINGELAKKEQGYRFSFKEVQNSKWSQALNKLLSSQSEFTPPVAPPK